MRAHDFVYALVASLMTLSLPLRCYSEKSECDILRDSAEAFFVDISKCEVAADCVVMQGGTCPSYCWRSVNRVRIKSDEGIKQRKSFQNYIKMCTSSCKWKACGPDPIGVDCVKGRCEVVPCPTGNCGGLR